MSGVTNYSLKPISGALNQNQLYHLLRRSLCGVGEQSLIQLNNKTIEECLGILLKPSQIPKMLPQEDPDIVDPLVQKGEMWVTAPFENEEIDKKRRIYWKGWWVGQMLEQDLSITEKMILFWHNHLPTEAEIVKDARYSYQYHLLIREHCLGNVKDLVKAMITNPAMLVYLNGNTNSNVAPNENFARELLELFTIGKERSDNYTESDVREVAKVLTGWKDNKTDIKPEFVPALHDRSNKQFSACFNNYTIPYAANGSDEIESLVDMIFKRKDTAFFICKNLYRWFVSDIIDSKIETEIITPLAEVFVAANFEVKPVLHLLLASEHFFDPMQKGCLIKSPVDFLLGLIKTFNIPLPSTPEDRHMCWIHFYYYLEALGMNLGDPPSVAGWPAYHQSPKFGMWWINSATLSLRAKLVEELSTQQGLNCNGPKLRIDYTRLAAQVKNNADVDHFLSETILRFFAIELDTDSKNSLKHQLLQKVAKANFTWAFMWQNYNAQHPDKKCSQSLELTLSSFYKALISMPEFQIT